MELNTLFQPGDNREEEFQVEEKHTAYHIGSGDSRVLSTPSMISFMEQVAHRLLEERLPQEMVSVGIAINIRHMAATPIHSSVTVLATLQDINENRMVFLVTAQDEWEILGEGIHHRSVIDRRRLNGLISHKKPD